jgi:electron transfer flavoprotein beta subunit
MMTVAQKVKFELVPIDGQLGGFTDAHSVAAALAEAIQSIPELDRSKLLVFGGWESASRAAGATMQVVGERLGIWEQFQGVDQLAVHDDGTFEVCERVEGGRHQVSRCSGPPAVLGWATGSLAEPRNNPQIGMVNMKTIMPALQKARSAPITTASVAYNSVALPKQQRDTRIEKTMSPDEIAREIAAWIQE